MEWVAKPNTKRLVEVMGTWFNMLVQTNDNDVQ